MQVKCINNSNGNLPLIVGKIYTVDRVDDTGYWLKEGWYGTFKRFETVSPTANKTKVYIGGRLAEPLIVEVTKTLTAAGFDAFSEWYTPGPEADVLWRDYEMALGFNYREALKRPSAQNTFNFDKRFIEVSDAFVMLFPAGRSAHLELGYAKGIGKKCIIYMPDGDPERWDVMYNFADAIVYTQEELLEALR